MNNTTSTKTDRQYIAGIMLKYAMLLFVASVLSATFIIIGANTFYAKVILLFFLVAVISLAFLFSFYSVVFSWYMYFTEEDGRVPPYQRKVFDAMYAIACAAKARGAFSAFVQKAKEANAYRERHQTPGQKSDSVH